MVTEGNGGLGSSEEVREGPLMDPAHERSVGSLELNSMTTRAIEGLNSSEEREGQQMVPAHGRNQMHGLYGRNLQLRFHQSMFPDSFFTERNVEGQDGAPIRVKLIDTSTCDVVRSGPLSCVKLKVVVVEGDFNNEDADDWTQEDFERRVVKEREGKRPLLIGNLSVRLEGGVGPLGKFSFTDNSSWTRSKKFRLGVKVALDLWEDIRVREAITNPFVVKDRRGKGYEKHYPPALDDEVWRLETIGKNGPFHKRLHSEGISKVKDFIWLLGIDAQGLRKILGSSMKDKTWDTLVEHAKTCDLSGKYHVYYADKMKNSGIVFKNTSELCGLIEDGECHSTETLSDRQKVFADTLKKEAYAKWKNVVEYDGLLPLEMNPSKRARSSQTEVREAAFEHFVKSGPASVAAFLMENSMQNTSQWLEPYARRLVREAFEHFVMSGPAMVGGREQIQEPDRSIMQLRFQTSMPAHFFVGKKAERRGGALICVKLIDATTGHVVESGPLSSLILDVVVLAGDFNNEDDDDWTWEHFKSKVEPSREGKGPLLEGDLRVPLKGGVGLLEDIKFTDISTCRPSGKFRLGVKVETGFFKGIRVREAKTDAFEVKHYKKESEEKNVPRALDDDVCTLKSIRKNGPSDKNLKDAKIFKVKHFLWKLLLDPEGLREILGKTMSNKKWKTLRDHAKESVPSGKYHVYYADKMKNSGVVFKNMSELCGLIEDGQYHSTETLSDSQKVFADNLKKEACVKWKDIVEYDVPLLLETNPSKRARFSQTDLANRKRNGAMDILANQIPIEIGGDVDELERWDPNPKVHCRLLDELGDRVTDIAPLRFLWKKKLKASDVSGQQNRFVLPRNVVGDIIVHCLTIQQRDDLCNNGAEIQIAAFDEQGEKWMLKLKKTMQSGHNFGTYVLIKDWSKMVKANGWEEDDEIKIWGLPYGELRDQWRFGPDHDFSDITFVFTTTV